MNAPSSKPDDIYLQPGQYWFGGGAVRLRAVLGSRAAFTYWHRERQLGGLAHLPAVTAARIGASDPTAETMLEQLLAAMRAERTEFADYDVTLYCGGRMFASASMAAEYADEQRVQLARASRLLRNFGAAPRVETPGSHGRRQLLFDLGDGGVCLQPWPRLENFACAVQVSA